MTVKQTLLQIEAVLEGYDAVSQLYPYCPPMSMWRAWEYAAYQRYQLAEPVLDVGCGDGQYFRLIWPTLKEVVGVDIDPGVADSARRSGVYSEVHVMPAHQLTLPAGSFASAFANCSLEHMDHLSEVLNGIFCCLRPGGQLLLSVVTDKLIEWSALPTLIHEMGDPRWAESLLNEYKAYHHLVNALPPAVWVERLEQVGFQVVEYIPIVPEVISRLFLFIDHLWHVRKANSELGDTLFPYLTGLPSFPQAFRKVLTGVLEMERNWSLGSGAVYCARRPE
ncbi:class I SAM-dependent methyltransferase [Methylocaldum sp.]|uniref:class I SAM-dependent methyltransferase n=1 Tax=Methylocaldum sp. TaxID=1969727 RepID=UPI002D56992F|nr:class I SAM-dependent methyltransferase [Methylocaldum sp.]HYE37784.1 class I SAM-dependent methyltransferase [Methylocaldum sp.]